MVTTIIGLTTTLVTTDEKRTYNSSYPSETMQEAADSSQSRPVYRVALRLPPFWLDRPALWFAQAEAQFELASIISEKTKCKQVISHLDCRHAAEVKDSITSSPEQEAYAVLKTKLVCCISTSRDQRVRQLLIHEEIGDLKTHQHMHSVECP